MYWEQHGVMAQSPSVVGSNIHHPLPCVASHVSQDVSGFVFIVCKMEEKKYLHRIVNEGIGIDASLV